MCRCRCEPVITSHQHPGKLSHACVVAAALDVCGSASRCYGECPYTHQGSSRATVGPPHHRTVDFDTKKKSKLDACPCRLRDILMLLVYTKRSLRCGCPSCCCQILQALTARGHSCCDRRLTSAGTYEGTYECAVYRTAGQGKATPRRHENVGEDRSNILKRLEGQQKVQLVAGNTGRLPCSAMHINSQGEIWPLVSAWLWHSQDRIGQSCLAAAFVRPPTLPKPTAPVHEIHMMPRAHRGVHSLP